MPYYQNYIIRTEKSLAVKKYKNLVVFCHFDNEGLINDNVVYYLKDLHNNCDADIIFVSNSENLQDKELEKISAFCTKKIIKQNKGYDFSAYMTGLDAAEELEKYKTITFCNDSVYGPFYSLSSIYYHFINSDYDVYGITDNIYRYYHLQSYFIIFRQSSEMLDFLRKFSENFEFVDDKKIVVEKYEIGLSRQLLLSGFRLGALCSHYDSLYIEARENDKIAQQLIENRLLFMKKKFFERINIFNKFKLNKKRFFNNNITEPQNSLWYISIKYQKNPFIKKLLVNDSRYFFLHNFYYKYIIESMYPNYHFSIISQESHKKRFLIKK